MVDCARPVQWFTLTCSADRSALVRALAGLLFPFAALSFCFAGQESAPAPAARGARPIVMLDPAHGGPDTGARLSDSLLEKDVTLALAGRLRAALSAAGFTVGSTRDGELGAVLSADERAEIANRPHVLACLVLHATQTGSGAHLYISPLRKPADSAAALSRERQGFVPVPWNLAQASAVDLSEALSKDLAGALEAAHIPVLSGRAVIRPLDNLLCPAVVLEIAPLGTRESDRTPVSDAGYQQHIAAATAAALEAWRTESESTASNSPPGPAGGDK